MQNKKSNTDLHHQIHQFVTKSFKPRLGELTDTFETNPLWQKLSGVGTQLWLDTGSIEDAQKCWTREFAALTTNNTLLNREVQTGRYDSLIAEAAKILAQFPDLSEKERIMEIAFILNAWHGLRLVETFDAYVSVEEHTDLAGDLERAVETARRYYAICPERFIVKIPFTPAGLLTTRRLSAEGIPINHTLGFAARQNYLIARIGRPKFVNVFLGRLNSFVAKNNLGPGTYVGEKTTLASQAAVKELRRAGKTDALQIGASYREGLQVIGLAGIDVMTMPPKVADQFLSLSPDEITDQTSVTYAVELNDGIDPQAVRLNTLWDINQQLIDCIDALEQEDIDAFTPDDLIDFFADHSCDDVLVRWTDAQIQTSKAEGKIPQLKNWKDDLAKKSIGLDALMNLAGLNSFIIDQQDMDDKVREVLKKTEKISVG